MCKAHFRSRQARIVQPWFTIHSVNPVTWQCPSQPKWEVQLTATYDPNGVALFFAIKLRGCTLSGLHSHPAQRRSDISRIADSRDNFQKATRWIVWSTWARKCFPRGLSASTGQRCRVVSRLALRKRLSSPSTSSIVFVPVAKVKQTRSTDTASSLRL
jgi:hypothetical protein